MPRFCRILPLAILVLLPLATPGLAQTGMLRGEVVDPDLNPIPGVQVTVTSEELASYRKSLTTDKRGGFRLRFQPNQTQYQFLFLFEKPGYQSFTQPIAPSVTQVMQQQFVMEIAETQVVESHGDLGSVVTGSNSAAVEAFNEGLSAQKAGDLDLARSRYEQAAAADPTLGPAHVGLAQVLLDEGEYAPALEAADRALELATNRAEALRVKHQALRALGRNDEAEAVAAQLVEADDASARARLLYNEGGEAFQAGDREAALAKFQEAARIDSSLTDAHHAIATLEYGRGNYEVSAKAAETALSLGSEDVRTLRVLYDAYDALGRTDDLIEIAPRLAEIDPDFGGPKLVEQAAAMWNAGEAERAVSLSKLALAVDSTLAKPHYFLGLDHLSKGQNPEARAALEKFIQLAPDDPEAATAKEMLAYIE